MQPNMSREVFNALTPEKIEPHGDRYLVEKIHVDNVHIFKKDDGETVTIDIEGTNDVEEKAGYFVGLIIRGGNGVRHETGIKVPMPYRPGDYVLIERFTGREMNMRNRIVRMVSQVDILGLVEELSPPRAEELRALAVAGA